MRYVISILMLAGCAADGAALQDTGTSDSVVPPEPPPGATSETRYAFDCTTLELPDVQGVADMMPGATLPMEEVAAKIPGYHLDPDNLPLDMALYIRASERLLEYATNHDLELEQGYERWRSDVAFDANGQAMITCGVLPTCVQFPCTGFDEHGKVDWSVLVGWTEGTVELIVWE